MLVNNRSIKVSNMGRKEQLSFFEVSCNYNNGYLSVIEILRPVKKIKGKWVDIKMKEYNIEELYPPC